MGPKIKQSSYIKLSKHIIVSLFCTFYVNCIVACEKLSVKFNSYILHIFYNSQKHGGFFLMFSCKSCKSLEH